MVICLVFEFYEFVVPKAFSYNGLCTSKYVNIISYRTKKNYNMNFRTLITLDKKLNQKCTKMESALCYI